MRKIKPFKDNLFNVDSSTTVEEHTNASDFIL